MTWDRIEYRTRTGTWWFWNEHETKAYGPYTTRVEAEEAQRKHAE